MTLARLANSQVYKYIYLDVYIYMHVIYMIHISIHTSGCTYTCTYVIYMIRPPRYHKMLNYFSIIYDIKNAHYVWYKVCKMSY